MIAVVATVNAATIGAIVVIAARRCDAGTIMPALGFELTICCRRSGHGSRCYRHWAYRLDRCARNVVMVSAVRAIVSGRVIRNFGP